MVVSKVFHTGFLKSLSSPPAHPERMFCEDTSHSGQGLLPLTIPLFATFEKPWFFIGLFNVFNHDASAVAPLPTFLSEEVVGF
jgi:hypothetical protein